MFFFVTLSLTMDLKREIRKFLEPADLFLATKCSTDFPVLFHLPIGDNFKRRLEWPEIKRPPLLQAFFFLIGRSK